MRDHTNIIPETDFGGRLSAVQKPGRYTGGEFGLIHKQDADFRVCVSYPDLYEIGMSNQAVQILYSEINRLSSDIACERVFAPAPDFEKLLRSSGTPLYGLEEGTPLHRFDLLAFSAGYELTLTNLFTVLDCGGVPVLRAERGAGHPIVIAGGPGTTNPVPLSDFVDAVYIGEWEAGCNDLLKDLAGMKKRGAGREDMLERVGETPGMWLPGRAGIVLRQMYEDFAGRRALGWVVPGIQTVQDHGVVEIMRGCPSGCRFCHAGIFYRPQREKPLKEILDEVDYLVHTCGYREITLSSLSTADYTAIAELVEVLNRLYQSRGISFSLPSLRINTFTLNLLKEVSRVRKSGLTFAVETPAPAWQRGINKEAGLEKTIEIMMEAKKLGWKQAKLYFMIGLPFAEPGPEGEAIKDFCWDVQKRTGMNLNINVGTFVPKPHTPFQWSRQLTDSQAFETLITIKRSIENRRVKVNFHSPFVSFLEGVLSRGDERAGRLFYEAFLRGARLDSWEEYLKRDTWKQVLAESGWNVEQETCRERKRDEELPWKDIRTGVSEGYLYREYEKALEGELTGPCTEDCDHLCGVCSDQVKVRAAEGLPDTVSGKEVPAEEPEGWSRLLCKFTKAGKAQYLSHINVMTVFERALQRAGIPVRFTEGFNPKPHLEFARPLSLGIASDCEYLAVDILGIPDANSVAKRLNSALPEGLQIVDARIMLPGDKRNSLMKAYWGSTYRLSFRDVSWKSQLSGSFPDYMKIIGEGEHWLDLLVEDGTGQGPSLAKFLKGEELEVKGLSEEVYSLKRLIQYARSPEDPGKRSTYEEVFCSP